MPGEAGTEGGLQRVNRLEQLSPPLWRELLPGGEALEIRQGQVAQRPGHVKAQLEGSPLVGPPFVVVGGRDSRGNGDEMRWARLGRLPLGGADVGAAIHPHLAERPGLGGGPLDGVVAVVDVVPKA